MSRLLPALLITALAFAPLSSHAASVSDLEAQIRSLQTMVKAANSGSAETASKDIKIAIVSENGSDKVVKITGLTSTMVNSLKAYEMYGYRLDFRLVSNSGKRYDLYSNFATESTVADAVATVYFQSFNPNRGSGTNLYPAGTYVLEMDLYKEVAGTPSYVLNKQVYATAKSAPFVLSTLGTVGISSVAESATVPTCTLTATPSTAKLNKSVKVSWTSTGATKLAWVKDSSGKDNIIPPKTKPKLNGSKSVKVKVFGNPYMTMKASNKTGSSTCKIVIPTT